jgi:hypothetical protein
MARVLRSLIAGSLLTLGISGCELDVDLNATPNVPLGGEIELEAKVTNLSNCPVGLATLVVIPNIPRNILIDEIPDEDIRRDVSRIFDQFCSTGDFEVPEGASGECQIDGGDLVCEIDLGDGNEIPDGAEESLILGVEAANEAISCNSDGDKVTCRIPKPVLDEAAENVDQSGEQVPFICVPFGPIVVCTALILAPGEMQTEDFTVQASIGGVVRHFAIAFPQVAGGVCRGGLAGGAPCDDNADCTLFMVPGTCEPAICSGSTTSSENGKGCNPMTPSHCDNGTCSVCNSGSGNLLSGAACDATAVGAAAPTMSMWGYVFTALALCVASMFVLMRSRRQSA